MTPNPPISQFIVDLFAVDEEAPEELVALAEHHKEILERKFPSYRYSLFESLTGCSICVETTPPFGALGLTVLEVSFLLSCVYIAPTFMDHTFISYANPNEFTDDMLSDILERAPK